MRSIWGIRFGCVSYRWPSRPRLSRPLNRKIRPKSQRSFMPTSPRRPSNNPSSAPAQPPRRRLGRQPQRRRLSRQTTHRLHPIHQKNHVAAAAYGLVAGCLSPCSSSAPGHFWCSTPTIKDGCSIAVRCLRSLNLSLGRLVSRRPVPERQYAGSTISPNLYDQAPVARP